MRQWVKPPQPFSARYGTVHARELTQTLSVPKNSTTWPQCEHLMQSSPDGTRTQLSDPDLLAIANILPGRCRSRLQTRVPLGNALANALEHKPTGTHLCMVSCIVLARGVGRTSTWLPGCVLCSQKPSKTGEVQPVSPLNLHITCHQLLH